MNRQNFLFYVGQWVRTKSQIKYINMTFLTDPTYVFLSARSAYVYVVHERCRKREYTCVHIHFCTSSFVPWNALGPIKASYAQK